MSRTATVLGRLLAADLGADTSDADLLARFARDRDDAAFAALVRRHGPMVVAVARRAVRDADVADDVAQAVFLVLARKAGRLARPDRLAFSPDGRWVAGPDRVWAAAALAEVRRLVGGRGATALGFGPDAAAGRRPGRRDGGGVAGRAVARTGRRWVGHGWVLSVGQARAGLT